MIVLAALVSLTMLVPPLAGYERYVVDDGTMAPAIPRGSVVIAQRVPVSKLRKNDVITYTRPRAQGPVTDRIVSTDRDRFGRRVFWTKGDADARPDPRPVHLSALDQPRVAFHVPYAGWLPIAAADPSLQPLLLAALMLAIVAASMAALWRESVRPLPVARHES